GRFHEGSVFRGLRRSRRVGPPTPKIVAYDPAQYEPGRSYGPLHRTADLGLSDARVVAHGHFLYAESRERRFQDHLHGPAVRGLFECEGAEDVRAAGAERTEVRDADAVQEPDQAGREAISEGLVPRQASGVALAAEPRTQRDVGSPFDDRCQHDRQLR